MSKFTDHNKVSSSIYLEWFGVLYVKRVDLMKKPLKVQVFVNEQQGLAGDLLEYLENLEN